MSKTILVLCAHSDDHILGPGATLAKYAKQGKRIVTIIFSYGQLAMPHIQEKIAIRTRVEEAKAADKIINGHKVLFFGIPEKGFAKHIKEKKISKKIIELIKKYKPEKIFTHSFDDPHPGHRDVYKTTMEALDKINYKGDVYAFDVWNPLNFRKRNYPKLYVNVDKTFKTKVKAIGCFESQFTFTTFLNFLPLITMYVKALVHGFRIGGKYAERFFKLQ